MKPTQVIDLFANIKNTFVSFFSILMFVALGVGVFLGISWASPALEMAANNMFEEGAFHNFQIQYPYGLTQEDLAKLSATEGVTQVEGERQSFQTIVERDKKYTVKVQSLGQYIDTPIIVEGELPTAVGEIALHAESARVMGIRVGDTISFVKDADTDGSAATNDSGMLYLLRNTFKVTALVNNADYVALSNGTYGFSTTPSGTVDALAWVPDNTFDAQSFQNGYPIVNVRTISLDGQNSFSDTYKEQSSEIQARLEALGTTLANERYNSLHSEAKKQIDEGSSKLADAESQIAQGEQEIADGEKTLESGRQELKQKSAEGQAELDEAYDTLVNAESELADADTTLDDAFEEYNKAQEAMDDVENALADVDAEVSDAEALKDMLDEDLEAGRITQEDYNSCLDERGAQADDFIQPIADRYGLDIPSINHNNYSVALTAAREAVDGADSVPVTIDGTTMTLNEARQKLEDSKREILEADDAFDDAAGELDDGWNQYQEGQNTLQSEVANAQKELADGEAQLDDAKRQVEDGKRQVDEKKPELEDAKAQLNTMMQFDWTVLPRAYNSGFTEVSTFAGVTNNLSISMAALFIIVGLLVSYFAISRIVRDQVTQIGTKKALGIRRGEITSSFLWYSGIAVLTGSIVGAIIGFFLVEGIIGSVLGGMFAFGAYPSYFGWGLFLIITGIELALVLGATYLACRKILKQHAVDLLRGDQTGAGKIHFYEKWGIWQKLPLLIQIIVNNCVNDKRRALSTIVGVAGCTALIVTAITLNNDVMKSYDLHYSNVYGFNSLVYAAYEPEAAATNLESALRQQGYSTAQVFERLYLMMQPNGESGVIDAVVPVDYDAFTQLYHVNSNDGNTFDASGEGAWVSQAYGEHLGAKVGDSIVIYSDDGTKHEIPILGFYEFWLSYNEMVVSKGYFEKLFGPVTPNVLLCQTGETPVEDVSRSISATRGFDSMVDDATLQYGNFETFSAVSSAVVIIYLVLAALMAVVVLLNLNVMFINEKKRELIVLMIIGYSVKDARHYISYDSIVLTALGIIVGLLLGCIMGSITVASIEPITGVFFKGVDAIAIIVGILGSALLAIIMSLIALRRINKFDLTDINRF